MNPLDLAGLILLAATVLRGMVRGFAREMQGLGGIVIAVLLALKLRGALGGWIAARIGASGPLWVWEAAAFLVLVIVVTGLIAALASRLWVRSATPAQAALFADVVGGGLVGLAEGWLLFSAGAALLLRWPGPEVAALLGGSDLAAIAFRFLPVLYRFLSGSQAL